jgi:hypothetical protein
VQLEIFCAIQHKVVCNCSTKIRDLISSHLVGQDRSWGYCAKYMGKSRVRFEGMLALYLGDVASKSEPLRADMGHIERFFAFAI